MSSRVGHDHDGPMPDREFASEAGRSQGSFGELADALTARVARSPGARIAYAT